MARSRLSTRLTALAALPAIASACAVFGRAEPTLVDHMYAHFSQVGEVQTALILGDLEAARRPAEWLAEHGRHPAAALGGEAALNRLRAGAQEVARASTVPQATRGAASMAAACGQCHSAVASPLTMGSRATVPEGDELGEHMVRHLWAADRMWEGLIGPSDDLWRAGSAALAEDALFLAGPEERGPEVDRIGRAAHQLGTDARRATDVNARAEVYGLLLATCADCHALAGVDWRSDDR